MQLVLKILTTRICSEGIAENMEQEQKMRNGFKLSIFLKQMLKFLFMRIATWHFKHIPAGVIIIRNDHLGDILVSLAMIEQCAAIAHRNSQSVIVVTSKAGYEILNQCPFIDHLIVCDYSDLRAGLGSRLREYRKITRFRAEKVVQLLSLGRSGESDYCALLPLSRKRYTLETIDAWPVPEQHKAYRKNFFNLLYTGLIGYDKKKTIRENEAELLSAAMGKKIYPGLGNIDLLGEFPPCQLSTAPFFIVVPGAYSAKRQWPAERFAAVIDSIIEKNPFLTAVISGSKGDIAAAAELTACCRSADKVIDLCGKTSLRQLFSNVRNAEFIITNDTGTLHIAALLNKKTFCIGGNWHFGAYTPDPCYKFNTFIHVDTPCKYCFEKCHVLTEDRYGCLMQVTAAYAAEVILQNIAL
jgi:ADP-heptose:LPS heptosyltransferase